ncbi:hypothetical protein [Ralstonia insidiosa]|uniref:Uncharacterized protein n=1 Tax=Ralstonia insidiosa TaxID=190721 RepID=A0A848NXZ6_9RALS|nr:hypothetical protein [Ralstonia insidiosa]NMV39932.1 hypothetical protein [Ralstonia insidiosa]
MTATSTVTVNALPDTEGVTMCLDAATHLYRLLARYNWCLACPDEFRQRWGMFWPKLRWCERALVRLCLAAQGHRRVGHKLRTNSPIEGMDVSEFHRPQRIPAHVEEEFNRVLGTFYASLMTVVEIEDLWASEFPRVVAEVGVDLRTWFLNPEDFVPWAVFGHVRRSLRARAWSATDAQHAAATLAGALHGRLYEKERERCGH